MRQRDGKTQRYFQTHVNEVIGNRSSFKLENFSGEKFSFPPPPPPLKKDKMEVSPLKTTTVQLMEVSLPPNKNPNTTTVPPPLKFEPSPYYILVF
jgi:hypothetical protein